MTTDAQIFVADINNRAIKIEHFHNYFQEGYRHGWKAWPDTKRKIEMLREQFDKVYYKPDYSNVYSGDLISEFTDAEKAQIMINSPIDRY